VKNTQTKLEKICAKYCNVSYNQDNYSVGGGLSDYKFASNRHEDAKKDSGKLTLGEVTQLFKKATGLEAELVREVIEFAVPNMEWHHAGLIPKQYGGGMKKTYFLKATEICNIAKNWDSFVERLALSKEEATKKETIKELKEQNKADFLKENAKRVERVTERPSFFYQTAQEMNGKYGWFDSTYKSYKLTEYYSGWQFESFEKYNEFLSL
jgi:hypothetical protein